VGRVESWIIGIDGKPIVSDDPARGHTVDFNKVTDEGIIDLLDKLANLKTQTPYYCGLLGGPTVPASNWTYSDIGSLFTEFQDYDGARQTWATDPASGNRLINPTNLVFPVNTNGSLVYGGMLVTDSTKGDAVAGGAVLFTALLFGTAKPLEAGESLALQYSFALSSAT